MTIEQLYLFILTRLKDSPNDSYVAKLANSGLDRIAQKVGEEAVETIIAAKNEDKQKMVEESADVLFHTMILLAYKGITLSEIYQEFERRKKH